MTIFANTPERRSDPVSKQNFEAAVAHAEHNAYIDLPTLTKFRRRSVDGWPTVGQQASQLELEVGPPDKKLQNRNGVESWIYEMRFDHVDYYDNPYISERVACIEGGAVVSFAYFVQVPGSVAFQRNQSSGKPCTGTTYSKFGPNWAQGGGVHNMPMVK